MRVFNTLGSVSFEAPPVSSIQQVWESYPDDASYIAVHGGPSDGDTYWNTTDNVLRTYRGTNWFNLYGRIDEGVLHLGDPDTDGTIRILNNAGVFEFWERIAGVYVLRSTI